MKLIRSKWILRSEFKGLTLSGRRFFFLGPSVFSNGGPVGENCWAVELWGACFSSATHVSPTGAPLEKSEKPCTDRRSRKTAVVVSEVSFFLQFC